MSTTVEVKISGDLENPRTRDMAEHLCKLVKEAVEQTAADTEGASATVGAPQETKKSVQVRRFDKPSEFKSWGDERNVELTGYIHLPPPVPEDAEATS